MFSSLSWTQITSSINPSDYQPNFTDLNICDQGHISESTQLPTFNIQDFQGVQKVNVDPSQRTVTALDLNGTSPGVNSNIISIPVAGSLGPAFEAGAFVTTTSGTITSATLTITGVLDGANELVGVINAGVFEAVYNLVTSGQAPVNTFANGGTLLNISNPALGVFTIVRAGGGTIPTADFDTFLASFFYGNQLDLTFTPGLRVINVAVSDPDNTLSAIGYIGIGHGLIATDDIDSIAANSMTPTSGNLLSNDMMNDPGDMISVSEVNGFPGSVGTSFPSTYGAITVMDDGSYSYLVDTASIAVSGLSTGESIDDIISYAIIDDLGFEDFGFITVTINGVTELPIATDNTNTVMVGGTTVVNGDVIFDDDGFGVDSGDRPLALFIWENQFTDNPVFVGVSGPVGGQSRTEPTTGVTVSFTSSDVDNIGIPNQDQVVFQTFTNGGHTGYLGFSVDPVSNPVASSALTMDFDEPVVNLSFTLSDVDWSQGTTWQDLFTVTGNLSGANVAFVSQVSGSVVQSGINTFYGTGSVVPEDAHGNVVINFPLPVDQVVISYNYGPDATDFDLGGQIAAVSDLIWQATGVPRVSEVDGDMANVGTSYATIYGTVAINGGGTYTYTLDEMNPTVAALPSGGTLMDIIPYMVIDSVDGSGNTANANLIITINGVAAVNCTVEAPTVSRN